MSDTRVRYYANSVIDNKEKYEYNVAASKENFKIAKEKLKEIYNKKLPYDCFEEVVNSDTDSRINERITEQCKVPANANGGGHSYCYREIYTGQTVYNNIRSGYNDQSKKKMEYSILYSRILDHFPKDILYVHPSELGKIYLDAYDVYKTYNSINRIVEWYRYFTNIFCSKLRIAARRCGMYVYGKEPFFLPETLNNEIHRVCGSFFKSIKDFNTLADKIKTELENGNSNLDVNRNFTKDELNLMPYAYFLLCLRIGIYREVFIHEFLTPKDVDFSDESVIANVDGMDPIRYGANGGGHKDECDGLVKAGAVVCGLISIVSLGAWLPIMGVMFLGIVLGASVSRNHDESWDIPKKIDGWDDVPQHLIPHLDM